MSKVLMILLLVCVVMDLFANKDSLVVIWNDPVYPDTVRTEAMYQIIRNYYLNTHTDSALILADQMYEFSKAKDLKRHIGRSLSFKGYLFINQAQYPEALLIFKQAHSTYSEIDNITGLSYCSMMIGNIYYEKGDVTRALSSYEKSLKYAKRSSNPADAIGALSNVGMIYGYLKEFETGTEYLKEALEISKTENSGWGIMNSLAALGELYSGKGDYEKALEYLFESLEIMANEPQLNSMKPLITGVVGTVYFQKEEYELAKEYLQEAVQLFERTNNRHKLSSGYAMLGRVYNQLGMYEEAIESCMTGFKSAEKIQVLNDQKDNCECLYEAYKLMNNGDKALLYHEKMLVFEDSLQVEETVKKLQQMEFQKQVLADSIAQVEKDRLVEESHREEVRKKNKTRNYLIAGGFLLLLLSGGFYSRWRYVRKSKAVLQIEKDRSETLLLNILPEEIAEELKSKGEADARDFDLVSILFTDFKGFTKASEILSAAELVEEINTCFKAFDSIVEKYKIEKIKTIGDAYMAAGGLPVPSDDSVKNTILAALEMQKFISARKQWLEIEGKPAFEMRVGIHSGPVVAGIVGVKKFQYDIWGDTVNTASRMESSGAVGRVNISNETYQLVKTLEEFSFESRGKVEAKGKGEIEMFFVSQSLRVG
jgi:adenylate cyclase